MSAYADTGFVVSLYKAESGSVRATEIMSDIEAPVWMFPLGELEICNAFQLSVFRGEVDSAAAALKYRLFLDDMKAGVFSVPPVSASSVYQRAIELADRHSGKLGTRSLDLMHVAAALLLGAEVFLSFDERQRRAAEAEGLKVFP